MTSTEAVAAYNKLSQPVKDYLDLIHSTTSEREMSDAWRKLTPSQRDAVRWAMTKIEVTEW